MSKKKTKTKFVCFYTLVPCGQELRQQKCFAFQATVAVITARSGMSALADK